LLEGSGESNETWQKSLDYVVDGAWDVKAIHAENADLPKKVTKKVKIAVLDSGMDNLQEVSISSIRMKTDLAMMQPDMEQQYRMLSCQMEKLRRACWKTIRQWNYIL